MRNELFHIGPLTIYGYGTMIALGILAGVLMISKRAAEYRCDENRAFSLIVLCLACGFASAKAAYWIVNWREILADPGFIVDTLKDGLVVMGGLIGGIAAGVLYCRKNQLPSLRYLDLLFPSVALGQGFGRIGCLLAGCCYGIPADAHWGITFHESPFAPAGIPLVPVQLYASALNFLNALVLTTCAARLKRRGEDGHGQITALYLILYSLGRFGLEFLRGDTERGTIGILSTSQFLSCLLLVAGAIVMIRSHAGEKRERGTGAAKS